MTKDGFIRALHYLQHHRVQVCCGINPIKVKGTYFQMTEYRFTQYFAMQQLMAYG